jgi:hypothetical protein
MKEMEAEKSWEINLFASKSEEEMNRPFNGKNKNLSSWKFFS